ncbi:alpha/beta hydrolase [Pedobacter rhodius]|uniref:Alpha/beta hydrolase-fold protein n=1 Tax=Pedobacter rhodius TaxID=3004098 RepID=A0ABT4L1U2_9SPHI|nr:alpha/beta hydrolase-fold protein [Pedobacter sp. SJ11]MCZ4225161.1 alpha/beta hydrolase-fold protein [Pedobacter sp. SJ11]
MKKIVLLTTYLFLIINSFAQNIQQAKPFVLGETQTVNSSILKENRTLNVYLPEGYSPDSAKSYPVIYLLDGSANEDFVHVAGLVQFLTMIEAMPKSILVGVANVDRKRDFTFPTSIQKDLKDFPTTGKSENFILFIEKELQPFIQKAYKANASKTIIGQSLGGLLATEILLKKPLLFTNYMIISPSLWWNNESLLNEAPKYLTKPSAEEMQVYISVGTEGKQMENDAKKLAEILQRHKNIEVNFSPLPEENHLTILHQALYKGFGVLYPKKK